MATRPEIRKVLVANRGEIARRIFATCRARGIATVAVYAEQESDALHVREADESQALPGRTSAETYLSIEALLSVARATGSDAIHPGYGFLSENADFAAACAEQGLLFLGPPAGVLRRVGDKVEARKIAEAAAVPVAPSVTGDPKSLVAALATVGTPALLKAAAGGGGRGMRRVDSAVELPRLVDEASEEAEQAFGDGRVYLERLVEPARHVEVQILADAHGNVATLGDRECSIQRRHQKIIEEAPAPRIAPALREQLHDAAKRIAREVGYVGVGTVELLVELDANGNASAFFFLEVNARLQVEHPVTELITGEDLVAWQIRIAEGEQLPTDLGKRIEGHAIEARVCAEIPPSFLPSSGALLAWQMPSGPDLRVDAGYDETMQVPGEFDSLLGKIIASGPNREFARERLEHALGETVIFGVHTNVAFLRDVLAHGSFVAARLDTGLLSREFSDWEPASPSAELLARVRDAHRRERSAHRREASNSPWARLSGCYPRSGTGPASTTERIVSDAGIAWVHSHGRTYRLEGVGRRAAANASHDGSNDPRVVAPMPGLVTKLAARPGDRVTPGDALVHLEAMKMTHELTASVEGEIREVRVREGDRVELGQLLVEIEER